MMDFVLLTKTIVDMLVKNKEAVSVSEYETDDENLIQIEVMVDSDDLGIVIGKNGKTINSIRTIVQASSSLSEENRRVRINVDSY